MDLLRPSRHEHAPRNLVYERKWCCQLSLDLVAGYDHQQAKGQVLSNTRSYFQHEEIHHH